MFIHAWPHKFGPLICFCRNTGLTDRTALLIKMINSKWGEGSDDMFNCCTCEELVPMHLWGISVKSPGHKAALECNCFFVQFIWSGRPRKSHVLETLMPLRWEEFWGVIGRVEYHESCWGELQMWETEKEQKFRGSWDSGMAGLEEEAGLEVGILKRCGELWGGSTVLRN